MIPAVRWRMWPVASAAVFAMQLGYGCGTLWNFASRIVPAARTASSSQVSPMSSV
jgi:hypothetical protein